MPRWVSGLGNEEKYQGATMSKIQMAIVGFTVLAFGIGGGHYVGTRSAEKPSTPVATLAAQADSNVVNFQKQLEGRALKTSEDSLQVHQLNASIIYWSGVRDAFKLIEDPQAVVVRRPK
jgi:hypothetical protein